jgi:hypothetical protein
MLRRSASPAAEISVSIGSRPLYPGDLVEAEVAVTPRASFMASVGYVRLTQTEVLRIDSARDAVPQMMLPGRRGRSRFGIPGHVDHVFLEDTALEGGIVHKYPVQLRLPVPAPPTVKGKYAQITWELTASILAKSDWMPQRDGLLANLALGRAGENSQEFVVFAHPDAAHIGGERLPDRPSATRVFRNLSTDLSLDSGVIPNGGVVEGELTVESRTAVKARELRVELVRWERSGNKQARIVESRQVLQRPAMQNAGEHTDWAFRLPVPDRLMPSLLGQHTFVGWQVRAVIDRAWRPNLTVTQLVQIYTSPRTDNSGL